MDGGIASIFYASVKFSTFKTHTYSLWIQHTHTHTLWTGSKGGKRMKGRHGQGPGPGHIFTDHRGARDL